MVPECPIKRVHGERRRRGDVQAIAEDTGGLVTRFGADVDHHNRHFLAPRALKSAAIMINLIGFN